MAKEWAKKFYNSKKAWIKCRDSFIAERVAIDGGMCQVCHEALGYIVHHKIPLTQQNITDPEVSLNHENLRYECKHCHDREEGHFIGSGVEESKYYFDENGELHPYSPLE